MEKEKEIDDLAIELQLNHLNKNHDYFRNLRASDNLDKVKDYCEALYSILINETHNYRINDIKDTIKSNRFYFFFKLLYDIGDKVDFYWDYCSFPVYQKTFNVRFEEYKNRFKGAGLIDFVNSEIENNGFLIDKGKNKQEPELCFVGVKLEYFTNYDLFYFTYKKKKDYLKDLKSKNKNILPDTNIEYDVDLRNTSAVQKIIYLNELGIIDFLRLKAKMGISNGGLASVLSAITGEGQGTIKPSLNRLDKNDMDDNKHPYYKKENVDIIKDKIKNLGL